MHAESADSLGLWVGATKIANGLLNDARRLLDDEAYQMAPVVATVMAHMAFEIHAKYALELLVVRSTEGDQSVREAIAACVPDYTFRDRAGRTLRLWKALTGDDLTGKREGRPAGLERDRWKEYEKHVNRRNALVHAEHDWDATLEIHESGREILHLAMQAREDGKNWVPIDYEQGRRSLSVVRDMIEHMIETIKLRLQIEEDTAQLPA